MTNGDQVVATRAECWMCSYCPVLASGKRGPTQEGILTVQIGTHDLTLHTHPAGEPLATRPKPNRPLDHGFYAEMGDYVVQALRPAGDIDGGQNPAFDAAFLYPGQVLPPHLTRQRRQQGGTHHHHQHYNDAAQEEEDEWDALLGWFGLGDSSEKKCDLPQPQRAGYPPIPTPVPNGVDVTPSYASEKPKTQPAEPEPEPKAIKREPPAPPPRADPFARLPPEYSGHKPADITGKVSHLRAAVGERSTWSYDKKDGVEPWTVSASNTTVPDQSPVSRSNVTTEEAKDTNTIDVAAKRRLEKLKALFGDDSEDEDELFTPTGTPKTSAQKPDADTFDDAQIQAHTSTDEAKTLTVKMKDVPSQVVQAAVETPDKVLSVAAESNATDAKLIKDAGDEAQRELEALRAKLAALEANARAKGAGAIGDLGGGSVPVVDSSVPKVQGASPPPPAAAVEVSE